MQLNKDRYEATPTGLCDAVKVTEQYKTDENLAARISIHDKYSTNKQGFGNWVFEQYRFSEGSCILELGCGNAAVWQGRTLPKNVRLLLTDLSAGMLSAAMRSFFVSSMI